MMRSCSLVISSKMVLQPTPQGKI
ncbi:hypothetical protein BDFB_014677 [Asbolus verrucosus]|uniref:Uncharacterized protein n=1 Tax=Asbolus verrucosus TaxID=1661398 RepID=A0A482VNP3_ASBVE|nr:hypothetical protein BDFB_015111 [Asbolus verrucosus]RZC34445.1 hypothetical protein BDFB_014677 [Asbolus verrucosus]